MIRLTTALLLSCLVSLAATAADVKIGEVSLHLPPPPGYCEMDAVLASDAHLIARMHSTLTNTGNRLLAVPIAPSLKTGATESAAISPTWPNIRPSCVSKTRHCRTLRRTY